MGNLVRAELYRLRQRRLILGLLTALLVLLPLLVILVQGLELAGGGGMLRVEPQVLTEILKFSLGAGVFFAIPCAVLAFSDQYGNGTLVNEAVFGVPRIYMYLSRLAAAAVLGTCLAAVCFGSSLVFSLLFYPGRLGTLAAFGELLPWLAGALPVWIASAAACLCFEFVLRSDRTATVLYFLYLTFGYLFIASFASAGQQAIAAGEANLLTHLNFIVYNLHPMTPFFPAALMSVSSGVPALRPVYPDGTWLSAGRCWLLGLAVTALSAGISWLALRRRELR